MAAIIYDPVQFNKKLEKMHLAGGKAGVAARQAEELIQELAGSDNLDQKLSSKLTKNGEARMENCCKFHLVSGHRLVMVRKDGYFVFLFLGTHDETDNWIKNNAGSRLDLSRGEVVLDPCCSVENMPEESIGGRECPEDDFYDRPLHETVDQQTLREVFQGLCSQSGRAAQY
ncbi:hypothetical protein [Desulfonatronum thioautotrophicum]|uniref:hypothetical protein n=1 Tax=Desulfonatronum thioautotrophicum TaxID=617001 RepID=UPI0005EB2CAE|nr:hypothetical protein [Desulfonatronum thioautotrophicum]